MNTQTIEVEIDATGQVHAVDPRIAIPAGPALLTPLRPQRLAAQDEPPAPQLVDWHVFVGALSGSPNWRDDPQVLQDRLRDEWQ